MSAEAVHDGIHSISDQKYACEAQEAVKMKFVSKRGDIEDKTLEFSPTFTHQVFGDSEKIFGYRGLEVQVYYTPGGLRTFVGVKYTDKVDPATSGGLKADNVVSALAEWLPADFITNIDKFVAAVEEDAAFKPFGEKLSQYRREEEVYEVYKVTAATPTFQAYYSRLRVFLIWYVDGANFTDIDDSNWDYYLTYKVTGGPGHAHYSIVGFTTTYNFFAYPDRTRVRISQLLVLPPYQRKGHGAELLQAVYNDVVPNPQVYDITVEDPNEEFTALRDYVDCRNTLKLNLPCFQAPHIHQAFNQVMEGECRTKLKLTKVQARRVYEILRLQATDKSNAEQYKEYRLMVKNKLNSSYQREVRTLEKLQKMKLPDSKELMQASSPQTKEARLSKLDEDYQALELQYSCTIERLAVK